MVWLKRDTVTRNVPRRLVDEEAPPLHSALPFAAAVGEAADRLESAGEPSREVIDRIRSLLDEGHFPVGSKLPSERALAMQLGVGRPALREAIKALCLVDILQSRRGAGTFVKSCGPQPLQVAFTEGDSAEFRLLEVLEVRKIVEPRAAWLAATRATERQLLEIEAAWQKLERHDEDWSMVDQLDCDLHAAIIRGALNPVMNRIGRLLVSGAGGARSASVGFAQDLESMRRDHRAIVEAIFKRQADAAELAMTEHLNRMSLEAISEASR